MPTGACRSINEARGLFLTGDLRQVQTYLPAHLSVQFKLTIRYLDTGFFFNSKPTRPGVGASAARRLRWSRSFPDPRLTGQAKFGPDVEWVDAIDYAVDPGEVEFVYAAIRTYWPDLPDDALQPATRRHHAKD